MKQEAIIAGVAAALALSSAARADYVEGLIAYDAGDYQTAESEWREAAEAGDREAMAALGAVYQSGELHGQGGEAESWYRRAAQTGHEQSALSLARILAAKPDRDAHIEALSWLMRIPGEIPPGALDLRIQLENAMNADERARAETMASED